LSPFGILTSEFDDTIAYLQLMQTGDVFFLGGPNGVCYDPTTPSLSSGALWTLAVSFGFVFLVLLATFFDVYVLPTLQSQSQSKVLINVASPADNLPAPDRGSFMDQRQKANNARVPSTADWGAKRLVDRPSSTLSH
jgi:hypothetical protein